jgi:hypothetical protein
VTSFSSFALKITRLFGSIFGPNATLCGGSAMLPDGAGLLFSHQTGPRTHLLALDHTVFFMNDAKKG